MRPHAQKFESDTTYRIKEKFHPQLNAAFLGVGVPFGDGRTASESLNKTVSGNPKPYTQGDGKTASG
jgi:hypothetical protein